MTQAKFSVNRQIVYKNISIANDTNLKKECYKSSSSLIYEVQF